jgi:hypothetical protein
MPHLHLAISDDDGESRAFTPQPMTEDEALALLASAEIVGEQLVPWGSNYTFAVAITGADGGERVAVYKPRAGEAPLYDFPDGTLYLREMAAYLLSRILGWDLVPPTVVREGPHGVGTLQLFIPVPREEEESDPAFWRRRRPEIERMVLFDHIANNADRKLGHCLRDVDGRIWGIDHGLTFNVEPKLRTVLWQYVGRPIDEALLGDLARLRLRVDAVRTMLAPYLDVSEIDAFEARVDLLIAAGSYPELDPRRNVPYGWW